MRNIKIRTENGIMVVKSYTVGNAVAVANMILQANGQPRTARPYTNRKAIH